MNYKDVLELIEPLVSERGFLEAKAFVLNRKTYERGLFFTKEEETKFLIEKTIALNGVIISVKHNKMDFIIVY